MTAPHIARGAAAAESDPPRRRAQTLLSLGNVATDPALRQIQLTYDPVESDGTGTPLAIQSFQLDASYDATKLDIVAITAIDGFSLTSLGSNSTPGLIDNISGEYDSEEEEFDAGNTNTGDQNFFTITFQLKNGVNAATPLAFEFFANDPSDNVMSTDSSGDVFTSSGPSTDISPTPGEIIPAFVVASVAAGEITSVPLPRGAWAGGLTLALVGAFAFWRRGRQANLV